MNHTETIYGPGDLILVPFDVTCHLDPLIELMAGCDWVIDDSWFMPKPEDFVRSFVREQNSIWWTGYDGDEFYGVIHLSAISFRRHAWFNGYGHKGHPRRAIEFGKMVIDFAFREAELHSLFTEFCIHNRGIRYVCKRLGFHDEARIRETLWYQWRGEDGVFDSRLMRLFRRDWEKAHG